MSKQAPWWQDKKKLEKKCKQTNYDDVAMAMEAGISRDSIARWRQRHGLFKPKPVPRVYEAPPPREVPWYQDKEKFTEAWEASGKDAGVIASQAGLSRDTVNVWRRRHGIALPGGIGMVSIEPPKPPEPTELAKQVHGQLTKSPEVTVSGLADRLDVSPARIRQAVGQLHASGFRVTNPSELDHTESIKLNTVTEPTDIDHELFFDGSTWEFAIVSDVHLGSKHEALDELNCAYDRIQAMEISTVLNPGDLVAGIGIYGARQRNHIHKQTYEEQHNYAEKEYPQRDGVVTKIIAGNHDLEGDFGRIGANPVKAVCDRREDMEYLGDYSAYITLPNGARVHMLHPMGGSSYAKSYRPQKLVESYEGGTKPNMLLIGHWHSALSMEIRNVWTMLTGCFERQNELGVRKGLGEPAVGFWHVKATLADDGSIPRVSTEFYKFHRGRLVGP